MNILLLIFIGCGLGGLLRYGVSNSIHLLISSDFPYGTLIVNVSGSLLMGFLFVLILERFSGIGPALRAFLLIGLLGGYTTFSSFSIETINLIESGKILSSFLNIFLSTFLCLGAAWLGITLGKQI